MTRRHSQICIRRNAFTLIELLVVIAIISLLVSILVPSLQKARDLAKQIVCSGNMHSIGVALALFAEERVNQLPPYYHPAHGGTYWSDQLSRDNDYLPNSRMYDDDPLARLGTVWKCSVPRYDNGGGRIDYGLNWYLAPRCDFPETEIPYGFSTRKPWPWPPTTGSIASLIAPVSESDCAMLSDVASIYFRHSVGEDSGMIPLDPDKGFRHLGGANVLFVDQHLECVPGDFITDSVTTSGSQYSRFWGRWW